MKVESGSQYVVKNVCVRLNAGSGDVLAVGISGDGGALRSRKVRPWKKCYRFNLKGMAAAEGEYRVFADISENAAEGGLVSADITRMKFGNGSVVRQLSDGTILVVNDKRNVTESDLPGDIDVVAKYSTDGGRTWSEPVYVACNGDLIRYDDGILLHSVPNSMKRENFSMEWLRKNQE